MVEGLQCDPMSSLQHFTKHVNVVKTHHSPYSPSHCYSKAPGLISGFKQPCTEQQPRMCCWPTASLFSQLPLVSSGDLQKQRVHSASCSQRRVQSYSKKVNPFVVSSITSAWTIWWWHQLPSHPSWCLEDQGLESPFFYQSGMTQCY